MHIEDYWLLSVNYLYTGEKIWTTVSSENGHFLEQKLKATNGSLYPSDCAQFLRHSATYIPHTTLSEWGIPYSLVHQNPHEVVITFPRAYHEGFSAGCTIAEAANYADANWNFDGYRDCETQSCPAGFIERELMCWRREGEEQQEQEEQMSGEEDEDEEERNDGYNSTDNDKDYGASGARDRRTLKRPAERGVDGQGTRLRQRADGVSSKPTSTGKGLKRKSNEHGLGSKSSKRSKKRLPFDASSSKFFEELQHIPQGIIQSAEVYQTFIKRSNSEDENGLRLLTRLFFAIASPDAFFQLRDACSSVRRKADVTVPQHINTVTQTVEALDNLETAASTNAILRRYHLTCLVEHRNERENQFKIEKPERATRNPRHGRSSVGPVDKPGRQQEGFGRASSMALADIMAEAYPGLMQPSKQRTASNAEYQRRYKTLRNRLCSGRNWHLMQQKFSPGILALVPTGGDSEIQNYEVEKLPVSLFTVFLDVLAELRGDFLQQVSGLVSQHIHDILYRRDLSWKYVFEKMDGDSLKKEPLDSPGFIRFCGLE
ncbi:hypothetical protein H2199_008837 [Coniosporium tulheliwenetii]|uniref:Uncharacterized protein n=1 Tax=Coniosporium tulheliwenetii TaxID=3383036 RepID=A0ACC2YGX5_9PEZI|nr:hypothetical protein H2199_008837 [Cladosporium sp. JES 115]